MRINVFLREISEMEGHLIGVGDPSEFDALIDAVSKRGVGGDVSLVGGQFIADYRGAGFEITFCTDG